MSNTPTIVSFSDAAELAAAFTERLRKELAQSGDALSGIMLSGGSTPLVVYEAIANDPVTVGPGLRLFMSDERHVARDDDGNNFHNAGPMFAALGLREGQGIPVPTELETAEAAAADYAEQLGAFFDAGGRIPLGMLGMGSDGHTASLFSAEQLEAAEGKLAVAVDRPDGRRGISLTPDVFKQVETLVFLVAGAGKQERVQDLLERPDSIPAGVVAGACPRVELWCDAAALGKT